MEEDEDDEDICGGLDLPFGFFGDERRLFLLLLLLLLL